MNPSAAADEIFRCWPRTPRVAVILGTGLGQFAGHVESEAIVPYAEIPGFPQPTALGHAGRLVCGTLAGAPLVALEGRGHLYEGYSRAELALPVQALARLGVELLIVSNASGGLNPRYNGGDILVIDDHIDLMFRQRGGGFFHVGWDQRLSGRAGPPLGISNLKSEISDSDGGPALASSLVPPYSVYDRTLLEQALAIARRENFVAHRGVYVAVAGPNYETRAEYRYLRQIGGDAVGMSTVPEVLAAAECGMRVLALSTVTNVARPDAPRQTTAEEVVEIAERAEPKLRELVMGIVAQTAVESRAAIE